MRDEKIYLGFQEHDRAINDIDRRLKVAVKALDNLYLNFLTQQMMWDCLMGLLTKKNVLTQNEFTEELESLKIATQKAMEEDAKKKEEQRKMETEGKVTVLTGEPSLPVVK